MKNTKADIRTELKLVEAGSETQKIETALNHQVLAQENQIYAGTGGISQGNRSHDFVPGYLDTESGETAVSCFADGQPAPIHLLEGLPETWILERNVDGEVLQIKKGVIAGFIRNERFYSRNQAARALIPLH